MLFEYFRALFSTSLSLDMFATAREMVSRKVCYSINHIDLNDIDSMKICVREAYDVLFIRRYNVLILI